jgi:aspartyl-tRNA(Asn)/glutamyl-tRNA(Gln) amidotransferase subunit B
MSEFLTSVGMEVHAELATRSKMFCRCPVAFGGEPNTRVCPVCLGLPGALPVPNRAAVEMVLRTALALNCTIAMRSIFHRKNYFYPDLPKGYQVSQYGETNPLGYGGYLDISTSTGTKRVRIRRVHLEEDTGKLLHLPSGGAGVDYNRAGVPLMEIVTEFPPDISTPEEARAYLQELRNVLLYLNVCDGKMEEGSLRCEPNISVRPEGSETWGTKTELKNLNSFRSVQLGIAYESSRQVQEISRGNPVRQETRGWNEATEASFVMRTKETEQDYRYFSDPDLVPMTFTEEEIEALRRTIPELPLAKATRYHSQFGLSEKDASTMVGSLDWAGFFEEAVELGGEPKAVCNWMNSDFARLLNETGQSSRDSKVAPRHIVDLTALIESGQISGKIGKELFEETFKSGRLPSDILKESGKTQISDLSAIEPAVSRVLEAHPDVVSKYKGGQQNVLGFLVGQVMKETQGRANPGVVQELLRKRIEEA